MSPGLLPPSTLRIHIGAPKTGSTAIQRALHAAGTDLHAHGVAYPDTHLRGWGHHDLCIALAPQAPDWATQSPHDLDEMGHRLTEVVPASAHTLLVSSENFYLFPEPRKLVDWVTRWWRAPDRIVVDVFVRRQGELVESWYNQLVKAQGFSGTFEDSVTRDAHLWDFTARLEPWNDAVGRDAIRVHPYHQVRSHVVSSYGAILGLPDGVLTDPPNRANTRLVRDALEYQRRRNNQPGSVPHKRRFHRTLTALSARATELCLLDTPFVTAERLAAIEATYQHSNEHLSARYCGGRSPIDGTALRPRGVDDYPGLHPDTAARLDDWIRRTQTGGPRGH